MREIELKFVIDERETRRLRACLKSLCEGGPAPRTRALRSIYYDTPDQALRKAGIALRLRRDGQKWVQTVKAKPTGHGGLQVVQEVEWPAPGGRLNLQTLTDADLRGTVQAAIGDAELSAICETAIRRTSAVLTRADGARVELALDAGDIKAGERSMPFREAEMELITGSVGALFDLTRELFPDGGLRFSRMPKSARGYLLAAEGVIAPKLAPRNAVQVAITSQQSAELAVRDVLRECLDQIAANLEFCCALDAPEGPHQLRIGLRRLRSAFAVFAPIIGAPEMTRLNAEARWLGQEVGDQRDLDVALSDLLAPEARLWPEETGFAVLAEALTERGALHRTHLRQTLTSARVQAFVIDLAQFTETRGWLVADDFDQTARLGQPVRQAADAALDKVWKKSRARARHIETLGIDARHALRKQLKQMRYAMEFFSQLFPPKRVKLFLTRLKNLQEIFGDLNDLAMAESLLTGPDAPARDHPDAQRAVGRILGGRTVKAAHGWDHAQTLWTELKDTRPFWE